jgi:PAS domain S-box-containing protein
VIYSERVGVCASARQDASIAEILSANAFEPESCGSLDALCDLLEQGAGAAVVSEEVLRDADLSRLAAWVQNQPSWSDFPFVVLTRSDDAQGFEPLLAHSYAVFGNVSFLEWPYRTATVIGAAAAALRARRRQYETRAHLQALRDGETQSQRLLNELRQEREKNKQALVGERAFSSVLLTAVPAGIVAYDRNLKITTWNPGMEKFFGPSAEQALGQSVSEFLACPPMRLPLPGEFGEPEGEGCDTTQEVEVVNRVTGRKLLCETQCAPMTGGDGHPIGTVAFFRDITERRHVEEQLHQAQKMETIGQLTGGVAHDFNNLLAAVMGNLELLRRKLPADTPLIRYIDGALLGASRGASLTQRLLAFARRQDLKTESVDLGRLLRGMQGLITRSIGPDVKLEVEVDYDLPAATVDHHQFELALLNLATNARDAMPGGGVVRMKVDLGCGAVRPELAPGEFLRVSVSDTGAGMDARTLKSAIEPFFSTKQLGKGTGLGLSMVHGLAVQLGGALRLSSTVGEGTVAELWVPVADSAATGAAEERTLAATPQAPASRILVVDDDSLIAMSTVGMIEDLGHSVIEASSGLQALDILKSGVRVDALVTDYAMPGMTGVELAGHARALFPHLPILLATGYAELPAGTTTNLPRLKKPYRQQDLSEQLSRLLGTAPAS